jgi:hypothetical protein
MTRMDLHADTCMSQMTSIQGVTGVSTFTWVDHAPGPAERCDRNTFTRVLVNK